MPLHPEITDIALRLLLTLAAGFLIGFDRGERGHAAGLRTTMLVCLAASVAMVQMNFLLPVAGKAPDSFSVMDVMRLPLGILSGIGFIGAGAILRKGDAITGVTTAATLWLVTVIGLCFGGGQLWLGVAATTLGWGILSLLRRIDLRIAREQTAHLMIDTTLDMVIEPEVTKILSAAEIRSHFVNGRYDRENGAAEIVYEIRWKARLDSQEPRDVIRSLLELPGVTHVRWDKAG